MLIICIGEVLMVELCVLCDTNKGSIVSDVRIISDSDFSVLVCKSCLIKEIRNFLEESGIDESSYQLDMDPHFIIEKDAYLNQKILNRIKIKIYSKSR